MQARGCGLKGRPLVAVQRDHFFCWVVVAYAAGSCQLSLPTCCAAAVSWHAWACLLPGHGADAFCIGPRS
jgi:hypothetical protein